MRILADVAPYSRQYQKYSSIIRNQTRDNPELEEEYERILEHVRKTKESTLQVAKRHFNAPVDTIEGTVKSDEYDLVPLRRRTKISPARAGGSRQPRQAGLPAYSSVCRTGPALPARPGPRALHIHERALLSKTHVSAMRSLPYAVQNHPQCVQSRSCPPARP
jgi:hypothetical protein